MARALCPDEVLSGLGERLLPTFGLSGTLCSGLLLFWLQTLPVGVVSAPAPQTPSNSAL